MQSNLSVSFALLVVVGVPLVGVTVLTGTSQEQLIMITVNNRNRKFKRIITISFSSHAMVPFIFNGLLCSKWVLILQLIQMKIYLRLLQRICPWKRESPEDCTDPSHMCSSGMQSQYLGNRTLFQYILCRWHFHRNLWEKFRLTYVQRALFTISDLIPYMKSISEQVYSPPQLHPLHSWSIGCSLK